MSRSNEHEEGQELTIRWLRPGDSITGLTELLHRAYARQAARGFRYLATWQDAATTCKRCAQGECFVAEAGGRVIGTVTLLDAAKTKGSPWFDRPDVACFGQFGVEPGLQGRGIGNRLMDHIERRAKDKRLAELALDTAEGATDLIQWYSGRGYRFIEYVEWDVTNYRSVIMSKNLRAAEE